MPDNNDRIDLSKELWNLNDTEQFDNETYNKMLIEQYKIYVEMADRFSARRSWVHTFFLVFHALVLGILGLTLNHQTRIETTGMLLFPLLGLLVLCYAWWRLVQYFRRVARAKQAVIAEMETRLPSSSFWNAERKAMSRDNPYNPLKRTEVTMPIVFALLYVFIYLYIIFFIPR